jgi:hypothetical protein
MLVVVVVGVVGVVAVIVVVVVDVPLPSAGAGEAVPTTVRVAAGVEPASLGVGLAATRAAADGVGTLPLETCDGPLDWLPVPAVFVLAGPAGAPLAEEGLGPAPVVGVVSKSGALGLPP